MSYYKSVTLSTLPIKEIVSLLPTPIIIDKNIGFVGKIATDIQLKIFSLLNIDPSVYVNHNILLVYFLPKSNVAIHSDRRNDSPEQSKVNQTLILPLQSCENLKWSWWTVNDPSTIFERGEHNKFSPVPTVLPKDATEVHDIFLNTPIIANVAQWHNLTNTGDDIAIGISIRLLPWSNQTDFSLPPIPGISYE